MSYLVTLCIPTNGVSEWCQPVFESIYQQDVDEKLFQVVVTDNGDNQEFKKIAHQYQIDHKNFVYQETEAQGFLNQIESFKLAEGKLVKFLNHRNCLEPGALDYFINYAKHGDEDTVVYFSEGNLHRKNVVKDDSFDSFVKDLGLYTTWSGGLAFWHKDLVKIEGLQLFNSLFPHTDVLFMKRHAKKYVIVDKVLTKSLPTDDTKKGRYNLFHAFADEYINILKGLKSDGDISEVTYQSVYEELKQFVVDLYAQYVLLQMPCSYDLTDSDEYIGKNFSIEEVKKLAKKWAFKYRIKSTIKKILGK
ncbi:glycosyltransferase family A protein [Lactobacillus delbrueckii]|uniref:glycosyltransferase family A protein n=1 Tax=Lactobacillus delbrueckii TaxID=1584 RepID=UPI003A872DB1